MKRNIFWLFAALLSTATFTTTMTSCENDPCKDVVCDDNSDCFDGECICRVGYEKDANNNCVLERLKFVGSYQVSETCGSGSDVFNISLAAGTSSNDQVVIANFYNTIANGVVATVNGSTLTIADQEPDNNGITLSGSGTYDNGVLTITYTLIDTSNGNTDSCTAVCTKL